MPSIDAPTWWADVQLDREELGGRPQPESWLDEEVDFTPRKRFPRRDAGPALAADERDLHGVFVHVESRPVVDASATQIVLEREAAELLRQREAGTEVVLQREAATEIVLEREGDAGAWRGWGDVAEPPATGTRRTVHITGRPEPRVLATTRERRPRSASDRVGRRPDRIVLWAAVLGAILILLAITSSDSHAATQALTQLSQ